MTPEKGPKYIYAQEHKQYCHYYYSLCPTKYYTNVHSNGMSRLISCNWMWVGLWIMCNQAKRPQLATARARLFYGQMINCYLTIRKREKGTNLTLEFGVSKQQISDMRKKKEERLDKALYTWFIQQRSIPAPISSPLLQRKAKHFHTQLNADSPA